MKTKCMCGGTYYQSKREQHLESIKHKTWYNKNAVGKTNPLLNKPNGEEDGRSKQSPSD